MGTNYYARGAAPCPCCHRPHPDRHIGKSSAGWCFALRVYPEDGLNSLEDWENFLVGKVIFDEYNRVVGLDELLDTITNRYWDGTFDHPYYASHNLTNGCLHAKIDGSHCVGNGEGTWDLIQGEFS